MPAKFYILHGSESFLIDKKVEQLKSTVPDPAFNLDVFDGEEADVNNIINAVYAQSLLSAEKMVLIKDADLSEKKWDLLADTIQKQPLANQLVIIASSFSSRAKITRQAEVMEFKSFAPWEEEALVRWIISQNKAFTRDAAEKLIEISGSDLQALSSEMEKISTYAAGKNSITEKEVEEVASAGETNVFALLEALSLRNLSQALNIFNLLARNKEDVFGILSLIAQQYRIMLFINSSGKYVDIYEAAKTLEVKPFFVKRCLATAKSYSVEKLKNNIRAIVDADLRLKTGEAVLPAFSVLLADLCG